MQQTRYRIIVLAAVGVAIGAILVNKVGRKAPVDSLSSAVGSLPDTIGTQLESGNSNLVAKVNGREITRQHLKAFLDQFPPGVREFYRGTGYGALR